MVDVTKVKVEISESSEDDEGNQNQKKVERPGRVPATLFS